jgi:hypothetical protein
LGINLTDTFFTQHAALKSYSTANSSDRNPSIYELLKFMADIISNDYFNHSYTLRDEDDKVIDKYESVKSLKKAAKEYYGEGVNGRSSKLVFKPTQGEYGIFMKDYFPALDTLSLA